MDTAMMLAKIFGPFLGIVGLWMLLYSDNLMKTMTAIKTSAPALYYSALINLLIGLFIINFYNVWSMDIFFFVTLLGWALFLRGLLGFFMPQVVVKLCMQKKARTKTMGIIPLIWGLILIWAGFYQ